GVVKLKGGINSSVRLRPLPVVFPSSSADGLVTFEAQKSPKGFVQSMWSVPPSSAHDKNSGKARNTFEAPLVGLRKYSSGLVHPTATGIICRLATTCDWTSTFYNG